MSQCSVPSQGLQPDTNQQILAIQCENLTAFLEGKVPSSACSQHQDKVVPQFKVGGGAPDDPSQFPLLFGKSGRIVNEFVRIHHKFLFPRKSVPCAPVEGQRPTVWSTRLEPAGFAQE